MSEVSGPILVTGATGQQGGATVRALLKRGRVVRALVRDPDSPAAQGLVQAGAILVAGDMYDESSLLSAMRGAHGVFSVQTFMAPGGVGGEVRQGRAVARAAARAGVAHVVYSSVGGADRDSGIPHFASKWAVEQELRDLALPLTVLRPSFFMDNFAAHGPVLEDGTFVVRLALKPSTSVQLVAVQDIAHFAAEAFEHPDEYVGASLELAGDELTADRLAATFGDPATPGRFEEVSLQDVAANPYIPYGQEIALMFEWFQSDGYQADVADLRRRHPGLLRFASWVQTSGIAGSLAAAS